MVETDDDLYEATWSRLTRVAIARNKWLTWLCIASIFLSFPASLLIFNVRGAAAITATIALHEAGHAVGMFWFGLKVLGVVFIPLLGAITIGEVRAIPSWKHAVISLLGPVPGIALAGIIFIVCGMQVPQQTWLKLMFTCLLLANVFNLIPIAPLDGWRFLRVVITNRNPLLDTGTLLAGILVIAYLVYEILYMVVGFALLTRTDPLLRDPIIDTAILNIVLPTVVFCVALIPSPFLFRRASHRARLRRELANLPNCFVDFSEEQRRRLFDCARSIDSTTSDPDDLMPYMKALHVEARTQPPGTASTVALLTFYGASWFLGVSLIRTLA